MDAQRWRHVLGPHVGLTKEHTGCGFLEAGDRLRSAGGLGHAVATPVRPKADNKCNGVQEIAIEVEMEGSAKIMPHFVL